MMWSLLMRHLTSSANPPLVVSKRTLSLRTNCTNTHKASQTIGIRLKKYLKFKRFMKLYPFVLLKM